MRPLVETNTKALSMAILLLRAMAGLILFVGGAGKLMGWFGGFGIKATLQIFESSMHLSAFWTYVSCYVEFIGGFLLLIGLLTRVAAVLLVINMLVAVIFVGFKNFFFGGAAFPFLLMIIFLAIVLSGPMDYSIDAVLAKRKGTQDPDKKLDVAFY